MLTQPPKTPQQNCGRLGALCSVQRAPPFWRALDGCPIFPAATAEPQPVAGSHPGGPDGMQQSALAQPERHGQADLWVPLESSTTLVRRVLLDSICRYMLSESASLAANMCWERGEASVKGPHLQDVAWIAGPALLHSKKSGQDLQ